MADCSENELQNYRTVRLIQPDLGFSQITGNHFDAGEHFFFLPLGNQEEKN